MLQVSGKFGETTWEPNRLIVLKISSATIYVLSVHDAFGRCGLSATPYRLKPCYKNPASLLNQNEIPIDASCYKLIWL